MPHNSMRGGTTIRIWRTIRHQRWGAGLALALAMVVGFGVPLGDASASFAVATFQEKQGTDFALDDSSDETASRQLSPDQTPERSQEPAESPDETPEVGVVTEPEPVKDTVATPDEMLNKSNRVTTQELIAPQSTMTPLALDATGCSYADPGSGAYAETLCWIDFTGFTTEYRDRGFLTNPRYVSVMDPQNGPFNHTAGNSSYLASGGTEQAPNNTRWGHVQNVDIEVPLGGGYVLTAQIDTTTPWGSTSSKAVTAEEFPTWGSAFLGNSVGGQSFYTGVQGRPALYQARDGGETTITMKNIELKRDDVAVRDFSIVVADAETTDSGEGIEWETTGSGFKWLPNTPPGTNKTQVLGNACPQAYSPGLTGQSQSASCTANTSSTKNGTAMLATAPPDEVTTPFQVSQTMWGNGRQGVAFGVITARTAIEATVTDRIVDASNVKSEATQFEITAREVLNDTLITSASTGPVETTTGEISQIVPVSLGGTQFRYESSVTGGTASSSYTPAWQCTKTDPTSGVTSYWPSQNSTSPEPPADDHEFTRLFVGQFVKCAVTYTPPYLSLVKEVDNGETGATNTAADFSLNAEGQGSVLSQISGLGNEAQAVTRRPVAVGQYTLNEVAPSLDAPNWAHGYDWTDLECVATSSSSTPRGTFDLQRDANTDAVIGGELEILAGNDITCRFTNTANAPQLELNKEAFDEQGAVIDWGEIIDAQSTVYYKLTFDNPGTAPIDVDHIDYLADVLDDSAFTAGSVRISDGTETGYPDVSITDPGITVNELLNQENPRLEIKGAVERAEARTVWFAVEVFANDDNPVERQAGVERAGADQPNRVGYSLNNYLVEAGADVPATCDEVPEDETATCTHHPIPAWTISKDSRPADGARLHKGGNTHYKISATKMNSATEINNLVFTDDLTHVFKTAGWAPGAAVPGGALKRGIYFFDENFQTLDASGNPIGSVAQPEPAYDENSDRIPVPGLDETTERWTLTTLPVTLPEEAMRAELWFAVEAGQSPAGIPDATTAWVNDPQNEIFNQPQTGWRYVNYVTAFADLQPNQCITDVTPDPNTGLAPTADNPIDMDFPEACRTVHELSDNYFTIRKDASGAGVQLPQEGAYGTDPTGLWNLVGHEFEIRDDINGEPSAQPSIQLCRAEYDPYGAEGPWDGTTEIPGATPAWGQHSEIPSLISQYNNEYGTDLPMCALLYAQGTIGDPDNPNAGGQEGRWRSEYLGEGNYWLVETKAPDRQVSENGQQTRPVPGVQLLAEPVPFKIWPDEDGPTFGTEDPQQSMQGRGQLEILGQDNTYLDRCQPGANVGERPVACVNPTGYLMIVKDTVPLALPFTGGLWFTALTAGGAVLLLASLVGIWWWRRQTNTDPDGGDVT